MTCNSIATVDVPSSLSILPRIVVALVIIFMLYYRSLFDYFLRPVVSPKELKGAYWFEERDDSGK